MRIIYKTSKVRHKNYKKKLCAKYKVLNLLKSGLTLIAKKEVLVVIKVCQKMN